MVSRLFQNTARGELVEEAQRQITYPALNVQIGPDGMLLTILLGPGLSINQAVNAETMHAICSKWRETQREQQKSLEIIRHVRQSKIN
jgi:hypothetical protein